MVSKKLTGEFLSPWVVLANQVKRIFSSISYVVKNPLHILPTAMVAIVWILIAVFNHFDKFSDFTSILSTVSFAKAGGSNFYAAVVGKSIFASAFSIFALSIFSKSAKKVAETSRLSVLKKMKLALGFPLSHIGKYLIGSGIAGGLFVFLSGNISKEMIAGGLACAYLSARAAIGKGFWKQFFGGFFRKRRGHHESEGMTALYAGMTVGFLAASGIGLSENNKLLLIISAVLLGLGLILQILIWLRILKIGGGKNVQKATAILILLTLWMPYLMTNKAWANQGVPFAPEKFPDSKYSIEIRENYEAAVEQEKLKAENLLFKEFFTITVQDKKSLEEVYRQDFSVSAPAPKDYYSFTERWREEGFIMVNSNHVWAEFRPAEDSVVKIAITYESEIDKSINSIKEKYEVEEVDNRAEKPIEIIQKEDFFKIQGTSELRNESLNSKREYNALLSRLNEIVQMKKIKEIPSMIFSQYVYVQLFTVNNDKSKPFGVFDYEKWDKMERIINETLEVPYVIQWGEASGTDAVTQKVTQDAGIAEGEVGTVIQSEVIEGKKPENKSKSSKKTEGSAASTDDSLSTAQDMGATAAAVLVGIIAGSVSALGSVATSAASASTAAASTATSSTSSSDANPSDGKEGKSGYIMYVSKDFGDAIRRGADPVRVQARIAEITDKGTQIERNDLTEQIKVSADSGLRIVNVFRDGRYQTAEVMAEPDRIDDSAGLVFTYQGENGVFTNTVVFRIVGEASIVFPERKPYSDALYVNILEGDGQEYEVTFYIENAVMEPEKIEFECEGDFSISYRPAEQVYTYVAVVKNNTVATENKELFAPSKVDRVYLNLSFKNGEKLESYFNLDIQPEGLSIRSANGEEGHLLINTDDDEKAGEFDYRIKPTAFELKLAYLDRSGSKPKPVFADFKEVKTKFAELTGDQPYIDNFREAFQYQIEVQREKDGVFYFAPQTTLSQPKDPFYAELPITCEHKNQSFALTVPLTLLGEAPTVAKDDSWDKEFELLKRAVARYGLSQNSSTREMVRHARCLTPNELSMVRRAIINEAVWYYTIEAREFNELGDRLARYEFSANVLKFFGDQAFAYLVVTWGGGPVMEAFVSPMKDLFLEFLGTYMSAIYNEHEINFGGSDLYAAISTGLESSLGDIFAGKTPPTPKKVGYIVAGTLFLSFVRHYTTGDEGVKGDIYKSLVSAFGDLAGNKFKELMGEQFEKFLKSDNGFAKKLGDFIRLEMLKNYQIVEYNPADIMKKYFTETLGLAFAKVYEYVEDRDTFPEEMYQSTVAAGVAIKNMVIYIAVPNSKTLVAIDPVKDMSAILELSLKTFFAPFLGLYRFISPKNCDTYYPEASEIKES